MPNRNQPAPRAPLQLRAPQTLSRAGKLKIIRRLLATWPSWTWCEAAFRTVEGRDADGDLVTRFVFNRRQLPPRGMVECPICGRVTPPQMLEHFVSGEELLAGDANELEDDHGRPIGLWGCCDHKRASIHRAHGRSPSGMSIQAWKAIHAGEASPDLPTLNPEDLRGLSTDPPRRLPRESDDALQREIEHTNRTGRVSPDSTWDADTGKVPTFQRRSRCKRPENGA